ncbi:TPA: hypothetical protein ACH3X3_005680 [Trebouxia sp. C0006]
MQSFKHAKMGCTLAAVQHALCFVHSRILRTACQGSFELHDNDTQSGPKHVVLFALHSSEAFVTARQAQTVSTASMQSITSTLVMCKTRFCLCDSSHAFNIKG